MFSFLGFRDTWGALVSFGGPLEFGLRRDCEIAGRVASCRWRWFCDNSDNNVGWRGNSWSLSLRGICVRLVAGTTDCYRNGPAISANKRTTARQWLRDGAFEDDRLGPVRILHAVRRFARMGKWARIRAPCAALWKRTRVPSGNHGYRSSLLCMWISADISARETWFLCLLFDFFPRDRADLSRKIHFDDRQPRCCETRSRSNVFLSLVSGIFGASHRVNDQRSKRWVPYRYSFSHLWLINK